MWKRPMRRWQNLTRPASSTKDATFELRALLLLTLETRHTAGNMNCPARTKQPKQRSRRHFYGSISTYTRATRRIGISHPRLHYLGGGGIPLPLWLSPQSTRVVRHAGCMYPGSQHHLTAAVSTPVRCPVIDCQLLSRHHGPPRHRDEVDDAFVDDTPQRRIRCVAVVEQPTDVAVALG